MALTVVPLPSGVLVARTRPTTLEMHPVPRFPTYLGLERNCPKLIRNVRKARRFWHPLQPILIHCREKLFYFTQRSKVKLIGRNSLLDLKTSHRLRLLAVARKNSLLGVALNKNGTCSKFHFSNLWNRNRLQSCQCVWNRTGTRFISKRDKLAEPGVWEWYQGYMLAVCETFICLWHVKHISAHII